MDTPPPLRLPRYYIAQGENKIGPLEESSVNARIRTGEFTVETLAWREGSPSWEPLRVLFPTEFLSPSSSQSVAAVALPAPGAATAAAQPLNTGVLGLRTVALLIDGFVLSIINGIVLPADAVVPVAVHIFVTGAYSIACLGSNLQATLGMYAMGLRLVRQDGGDISFGVATVRSLAAVLSGMMCLVGYFFAFFTPKNQTLHDIMAGTLVVRRIQ